MGQASDGGHIEPKHCLAVDIGGFSQIFISKMSLGHGFHNILPSKQLPAGTEMQCPWVSLIIY